MYTNSDSTMNTTSILLNISKM